MGILKKLNVNESQRERVGRERIRIRRFEWRNAPLHLMTLPAVAAKLIAMWLSRGGIPWQIHSRGGSPWQQIYDKAMRTLEQILPSKNQKLLELLSILPKVMQAISLSSLVLICTRGMTSSPSTTTIESGCFM
jgi:hypothetical protein